VSHATHANAALTPRARLRLGSLVVDQGWPIARAAERFDVSWKTAEKWATRYREEGPGGMTDRSGRPHRQPRRTPPKIVRRIVRARLRHRMGPVQIGDLLGVPASTVHAVLTRCRLHRLTYLDRATGEPIRRYEHARPGDLLHVDVKKLGKVPDGGGWRYVGRAAGTRHRSATAARTGAPKSKHSQPLIGTCYLHTVIDDHSRVAYVEAHDDETKHRRAGAAQRGRLVRPARRHHPACAQRQRRRVPVPSLGRNLRRARHHAQTDATVPATDQRHDRTLPPHPGRRVGLQEVLPERDRQTRRPGTMGPPVQPPPAPLSDREGRPHHQAGQPAWASPLVPAWRTSEDQATGDGVHESGPTMQLGHHTEIRSRGGESMGPLTSTRTSRHSHSRRTFGDAPDSRSGAELRAFGRRPCPLGCQPPSPTSCVRELHRQPERPTTDARVTPPRSSLVRT
jgi:transposase